MTTTAKDALLDAIVQFIGGEDLLDRDEVRAALELEIDRDGPGSLMALMARLSADDGWAYYPPDPLARRIHQLLAGRFLTAESRVEGLEHVATVAAAPVIVAANHLSYADANVIEILLQRSGSAAAGLAARLTALAGPKVFTNRDRRFSSLCFGTVKVPQSADVSSEEAVLNARAVARRRRRPPGGPDRAGGGLPDRRVASASHACDDDRWPASQVGNSARPRGRKSPARHGCHRSRHRGAPPSVVSRRLRGLELVDAAVGHQRQEEMAVPHHVRADVPPLLHDVVV